MIRIAAILAVAVSLAACDMFSTLIDGWKYAKVVEADLAVSTGHEAASRLQLAQWTAGAGDGDLPAAL